MLKTLRLPYKEKKYRRKKKQAQEAANKKAGKVNANKPSEKARRKLKRRVKNMRRKVNDYNLIEEWQKDLETPIEKELNAVPTESPEAGRTSKDSDQGE